MSKSDLLEVFSDSTASQEAEQAVKLIVFKASIDAAERIEKLDREIQLRCAKDYLTIKER